METSIEKDENALKLENSRQIFEAEKCNSNAVNESIGIYRFNLKTKIKSMEFLNEESFKRGESDIRGNTIKIFLSKCIYGDKSIK